MKESKYAVNYAFWQSLFHPYKVTLVPSPNSFDLGYCSRLRCAALRAPRTLLCSAAPKNAKETAQGEPYFRDVRVSVCPSVCVSVCPEHNSQSRVAQKSLLCSEPLTFCIYGEVWYIIDKYEIWSKSHHPLGVPSAIFQDGGQNGARNRFFRNKINHVQHTWLVICPI